MVQRLLRLSCIRLTFLSIEKLYNERNWDALLDVRVTHAKDLKVSGADFIEICRNTMNVLAEKIEKIVEIPVVHMVKEAALTVKRQGINKVLLLGTKYTKSDDYFTRILTSFGFEVTIPNEQDIDKINDVIYGELRAQVLSDESRRHIVDIINSHIENGVCGVVLGCKKLPNLIKKGDVSVPVFDTIDVHCQATAEKIIHE